MTLAEFKLSLQGAAPNPGASVPMQSLWWAAKNDWDRAHQLVQGEDSTDAAWVHAYLHRVEGDLGNARYWYARAGRPPSAAPLTEEWDGIVTDLLTAKRTD